MDYGLYFHIPFCIQKCVYCDFLSFPAGTVTEGEKQKYFHALREEWFFKSQRINGAIDSIYIGGGTPSCVDPGIIYELLSCIRATKPIRRKAEITIEVNPGTVTPEHFEFYRQAGINRISIGVQSTHDRLLHSLGRIHTAAECEKAVRMAQEAGFQNINCDLIFGTPQIGAEPGETEEELLEDLKTLCGWGIKHISAYSIIVEPDTPLFELFRNNRAREIDDVLERKMYHTIGQFLASYGYEQYEISNYARPHSQSLHNLKYWNCLPYLGFGLGAASYYPMNAKESHCDYLRESNTTELIDYCAQMYKGSREQISLEEQMCEFMMLGFRKTEGPSAAAFEKRFEQSYFDRFSVPLQRLKDKGLIQTYGRLGAALTRHGLDYANEVFREFLYEKE